MPDAVMIFAAGLGTRMGALTRDRPKPLLPLGGGTLLDHALAQARGIAPRRIVVNTHAHAGQVEAALDGQPDVTPLFEPTLLETGGGLKAALPLLGTDPVLTLNADAGWLGPNPLALLRAAWDPDRMEALMLLVPPRAATGHAGPAASRWPRTGGSRGPGR